MIASLFPTNRTTDDLRRWTTLFTCLSCLTAAYAPASAQTSVGVSDKVSGTTPDAAFSFRTKIN